MKFLFRSYWGEITPLALRVQSEGNEVQLFISSPEAKTVGDGLIRKAVDFGKAVQWSDIVIYEGNNKELPDEAEKVRLVRPVIGSSSLAGRLENDRMFAVEQAKKAGLTIGHSIKAFDGPGAWTSARRFLDGADHNQAFVWKPNGESPVQTYVANDVAELDRMLGFWQKLFAEHHEKPSFILTPKVIGVEVSTEGWWDGSRFSCFNHTIERNRLMSGDLGEKTGCMGNVVWNASDSRLANKLIRPLENLLGKNYRGPIDVNAIIREEDNEPVFLEFTPRFGYDAIFAFMELVDDFGQLLYDCGSGRLSESYGNSDGVFAGSYRITIPPYPEEPSKENETKAIGVPLFGLDADAQDRHFHFTEVRLNRRDELETSGPDGFVMAVSDRGSGPSEAMRAAYKRGSKIQIPQMRWRDDLDIVIQKVYDDLVKTNWLKLDEGRTQPLSLFGRSIDVSRIGR